MSSIAEMFLNRYVDTSPTSGRGSYKMTDAQWQRKFARMKSVVIPSNDRKLHGEDAHYNAFINATLKSIRVGAVEKCLYCYQIFDLLKFERDSLRTEYNQKNQFWYVWKE